MGCEFVATLVRENEKASVDAHHAGETRNRGELKALRGVACKTTEVTDCKQAHQRSGERLSASRLTNEAVKD